MVQIEDVVYSKLKKDADDNRQLINLAKIVCLTIIVSILIVTSLSRFLDLLYEKNLANLERQIALEQAETNKKIFEIESSGLTKEEYFEWLEVRNAE